jgi:hypothetical protein
MSSESKLKRRRAPDPWRRFVDRTSELALVQSKLDTGIQGLPMRSGVVCFWGAFGMGKSWLLQRLEQMHQGCENPGEGTYPTITARLDLDPTVGTVLWSEDRLDREVLIRELWRQLAAQMGTELPAEEGASPNAWAEAFVEQVTRWAASSATPVLLLDSVDHVLTDDPESFYWFEQQVIEGLAITGRVLFVFASRGELRDWKRFQVRRRVTLYRLCAFNEEMVASQVGASPAACRQIYQHAFGHPQAVDFMGTVLEQKGIDLGKAPEGVALVDAVLARRVLREVIQGILHDCVLREPKRTLARRASVLRWLSLDPLRSLAEQLGLVEPERGEAHYQGLLATFQAQHLLYWDSSTSVYAFDPVLRRLLAHQMELDDRRGFCAAHHAAYHFHYDHLERYPGYLARYVPELAYHRAILGRCCPETPEPTLQEWWTSFVSGPRKELAAPEPWAELFASLAADKELRELLPQAEYKAMLDTARRRAAQGAD